MTPQQTANKAPRNSNIELFRIIVMTLIVMHHYVVCSGLTSPNGIICTNPDALCWRSLFLSVCGAWGKIGINCFVFITGYYMCRSQITMRKFLKLVGAWLFYNWAIYLIFLCSGCISFEPRTFIQVLIPFTGFSYAFVPCYVVFFLFIPFLNVLIRNIDEVQHLRLIGLCCLVYVVMGSIPIFVIFKNYVTWFIVLYFISSYVRLYPKKIFDNGRFWKYCMLTTLALSIISVLVMCLFWNWRHGRLVPPFFFVEDSNKFLAVITALSAFMYFKNLKLKYHPIINTIAASTFSVLLIHDNSDVMRRWLWHDALDVTGHYFSSYLPLYVFGCVVGIFFACVLIDQVRIKLIEKPFFDFMIVIGKESKKTGNDLTESFGRNWELNSKNRNHSSGRRNYFAATTFP